MSKPETRFYYTYLDLVKLSDWGLNRIHQDTARNNADLDDFLSAALWVARNGKPEVRAKFAKAVYPVLLGLSEPAAHTAKLNRDDELILRLFRKDANQRQARAEKISKGQKVKGRRRAS